MKQGTGIIKFFLVVLTLVCLLQYFYMLPTRGIENDAEAYAQSIADSADEASKDAAKKIARAKYLDSMSNEVIFSIPLLKDYTYQELKEAQLAYGLDLVGGMSVVLQVDLKEFIRSLASSSKDPTFEAALDQAEVAQKSAQSDYVTLFADAYQAQEGDKRMAPLFLANEIFQGKIDYNTPDAEVVRLLREKANETVGLTFQRLRDRIDELGVIQPNVSLDAARDMIVVELPGISNPERARRFLQNTAKLEFWNVYRISDAGILAAFQTADDRLEKMQSGTTDVEEAPEERIISDIRYSYDYDEDGNVTDSTVQDTIYQDTDLLAGGGGPLLSKFRLNGVFGGQLSYPQAVMGTVKKNQMDAVNNMLAKPEIKSLFPADVAFKWSYKPSTFVSEDEQRSEYYELYAIKQAGSSSVAPLEGDRVVDASANPDPTSGKIAVSLTMDAQGANIWRDMTTRAAQDNQREVAILLDDKVVSAPSVNETIPNGRSSISGGFTLQEAEDLSKILQIGKLPAQTQIIQESLVGPSLGKANIQSSMYAMLVGFAIVFIFMIIYYGSGGIISIIALFMNLFFIFGVLASWGTVLTLPGIAGIILTIGMAVDANVIIYERIREELREGKSTLAAIGDGFQNSYSAIIDANVTTILTAFVLSYFGLGPIKGFAVVLIIGVLCSIFTAVLVGRLMIDWWTESKGNSLSFWTGFSKNAFTKLNFDWIGKRKMAYVFSGIIIAAGLVSMFTRGFDLGVDFKGGYSYNIEFDQDVEAETLRTGLAEFLGGAPTVKAVSTDNTFNVVTDFQIDNTEQNAPDLVMDALYNGVNQIVGGSINEASFKAPDGRGTHVSASSKVGPTIADDIQRSSIWAATFALLLIFLYIFIRFSKWQFSMGAVAALFHDVLVVLSVFSLLWGIMPFAMEIDQPFIAAILTVIGYSINDTVVVFDRIREYMNTYTSKSKKDVINMAVNSTWSRTVITSLTTLFVVLILLIFGGGSIKGFAFALTIGILVGTYSSVFIATPIMHDLSGDLEPKSRKSKSSFSRAKA